MWEVVNVNDNWGVAEAGQKTAAPFLNNNFVFANQLLLFHTCFPACSALKSTAACRAASCQRLFAPAKPPPAVPALPEGHMMFTLQRRVFSRLSGKWCLTQSQNLALLFTQLGCARPMCQTFAGKPESQSSLGESESQPDALMLRAAWSLTVISPFYINFSGQHLAAPHSCKTVLPVCKQRLGTTRSVVPELKNSLLRQSSLGCLDSCSQGTKPGEWKLPAKLFSFWVSQQSVLPPSTCC